MTTDFGLVFLSAGALSKGGRVVVYEVFLRPDDAGPVPTGILVTRVRQTSTEAETIDVVMWRGVVFATVADALEARAADLIEETAQ